MSKKEFTQEELRAANDRIDLLLKEAQQDPEVYAELEKMASALGSFFSSPAMKSVGGALGLAAVAGVGNAATDAIINTAATAIGNIGASKRKAKSFENMLEYNPNLRKVDSKKLHAAFNTLHKFNPEYASDPLVASEFVNQAVSVNTMPLQMVNQVVQAKKQIVDSQPKARQIMDVGTGFQAMNSVNQANEEARRQEAQGWKGEEHGWRGEQQEFARNNEQRQQDRANLDYQNAARQARQHGWAANDEKRRAEMHRLQLSREGREIERFDWARRQAQNQGYAPDEGY